MAGVAGGGACVFSEHHGRDVHHRRGNHAVHKVGEAGPYGWLLAEWRPDVLAVLFINRRLRASMDLLPFPLKLP